MGPILYATEGGLEVINLADKLSQFTDAWSPKIVGEINDMHVKVVKLRGEFVWHHHDREDELFLGGVGRLPNGTLNTGNARSERTVAELERI